MLKLVKPNKTYEKEIFDYKTEMIQNGDATLPGCGGLEKFNNFEDWITSILSYADKSNLPEGYVEGSQWLLVDTEINRVLGFVNIRHYLNDFLTQFGGHIGYSVRPNERRKGYGKVQLQLALDYLKSTGVHKVLITCDESNIGSAKTIESCGGVLENTLYLEEHGNTKRFWINIG